MPQESIQEAMRRLGVREVGETQPAESIEESMARLGIRSVDPIDPVDPVSAQPAAPPVEEGPGFLRSGGPGGRDQEWRRAINRRVGSSRTLTAKEALIKGGKAVFLDPIPGLPRAGHAVAEFIDPGDRGEFEAPPDFSIPEGMGKGELAMQFVKGIVQMAGSVGRDFTKAAFSIDPFDPLQPIGSGTGLQRMRSASEERRKSTANIIEELSQMSIGDILFSKGMFRGSKRVIQGIRSRVGQNIDEITTKPEPRLTRAERKARQKQGAEERSAEMSREALAKNNAENWEILNRASADDIEAAALAMGIPADIAETIAIARGATITDRSRRAAQALADATAPDVPITRVPPPSVTAPAVKQTLDSATVNSTSLSPMPRLKPKPRSARKKRQEEKRRSVEGFAAPIVEVAAEVTPKKIFSGVRADQFGHGVGAKLNIPGLGPGVIGAVYNHLGIEYFEVRPSQGNWRTPIPTGKPAKKGQPFVLGNADLDRPIYGTIHEWGNPVVKSTNPSSYSHSRGLPERFHTKAETDASRIKREAGIVEDARLSVNEQLIRNQQIAEHIKRNERGGIDPGLALGLGGAAAGGLVGASTGDDTSEKLLRGLAGAIAGGTAGALSPRLLRGPRGPRAPGPAQISPEPSPAGPSVSPAAPGAAAMSPGARELAAIFDAQSGTPAGDVPRAVGRVDPVQEGGIGPPPRGVEPELWDSIHATQQEANRLINEQGITDVRFIREMQNFWGAEETGRRLGLKGKAGAKWVRDYTGQVGKSPMIKLMADIDARFQYLIDDPDGFMNTEALLATAGATTGVAVGGLVGATIDGEDIGDKVANIISAGLIGGIGGMIAGSAVSRAASATGTRVKNLVIKENETFVEAVRRTGSGPVIHALETLDTANLLAGPAMVKAGMGALSGMTAGIYQVYRESKALRAAGDIVGADKMQRQYRSALEYIRTDMVDEWFKVFLAKGKDIRAISTPRGGQLTKQLETIKGFKGIPDKMLTLVLRPFIASDQVGIRALQKAGIHEHEARRLMMSGEPTSWGGQAWMAMTNSTVFGRMLAKFSRVRVQGVERGVEFTPGISKLFARNVRQPPAPPPGTKLPKGGDPNLSGDPGIRGLQIKARKEAVPLSEAGRKARARFGGAAIGLGTAYGYLRDPGLAETSLAASAAGPAFLPVGAAIVAGKGLRKGIGSLGDIGNILSDVAMDAVSNIPKIEEADIRRFPKRLIPGRSARRFLSFLGEGEQP